MWGQAVRSEVQTWLRRNPYNGAKVLGENTTWEAIQRVNCCSCFSFDLETPVKENNPFPALTGYFISRKHACYFSNCLGPPVGSMISEQCHLLVYGESISLLRRAAACSRLFVCMHAQSLRLCLCGSVDCSLPGSCVPGILQASILEWVAMPSSRRSSQPRYSTEPPGKPTCLYMNPKIMSNILISGTKRPTLAFKSKNQTTYS